MMQGFLLTLQFNFVNILYTVPNCVMVARLTLDQFVRVQILLRQPRPPFMKVVFLSENSLPSVAAVILFEYNVLDEKYCKKSF